MATKLPEISDQHLLPPGQSPDLVPAPPRRRRKFTGLIWLLLLGIAGFVGYRLYQGSSQQKQADAKKQASQGNRPISVVVAPVRTGDVPVNLRGLGTVTPFNAVIVKPRVDGQLIRIHFTEGDMVHEGQLLAEIDPRPFQAVLEQAQGQLAKDQAQLKDAQVNLARYQKLWDEQVIAKQQLDTQAASVGQFEGVIQADQATINSAKLQLTYANVTAPITGRVGLRQVDAGNIVHAADPNGLVVIDQMQPITVLFTIPADSLPPVLKKLLNHAKLRVDAYDRDDRNKIASGTLLTVDNQIDPTTGTSRLKATFDNRDAALFPNQFVNCRLLLDMKHNAVIVSAPALQRGPQGSFVYVVTPDKKAVVRNVTVGITEGEDVEIQQGLQAGETVVVEGQDKLQDGSPVEAGTGGPSGGRGRTGGGQSSPGKGTAPPPAGQTPPAAGGQTRTDTQPGSHKTGGRRPDK
jgi:membrane fusion protein, multidrug efflux system